MSAQKKRGLGRGLEALLGPKAAATPPPEAQPGEVLRQIPFATAIGIAKLAHDGEQAIDGGLGRGIEHRHIR